MASIPGYIFIDNDNIVEVTGLKDELTDTYVNDAIVEATLKSCSTGVEVTGQTWPIVLGYINGSNGDYRGVLQDSLVLSEDALYIVEIEAEGVSKASWTIQVRAAKRA